MEAVKINITAGKYPKADFIGILKAIYPSETKNGKGVLKIQCEDESEFMVMGLDHVTREETPGFMGVGVFLKSLLKAMEVAGLKDVQGFWQWDGDTIQGFTTTPDYAGAKCAFKRTEQKKIGEQETEYPPEWTVEKYELPAKAAARRASTPAPTATALPTKDSIVVWYNLLTEMPGEKSLKEVMTYLKEKTGAIAPAKEVKALCESMITDGFLELKDSKYKVVA